MARAKKKAPVAHDGATVTISTTQLVRHQGRTLASVEVHDDGLVVWRKRARGGRYDRHYAAWPNVIAYCEGEGGDRRSPVFAVVRERVVLLQVRGTITRDVDAGVTLTDAEGSVHVIPRPASDLATIEITYEASRPSGAAGDEDTEPRSTRRSREADPADEAGEDPDDGLDDVLDDLPDEPPAAAPPRRRRAEAPSEEPRRRRREARAEPDEPAAPERRKRRAAPEPAAAPAKTKRRQAPVTDEWDIAD